MLAVMFQYGLVTSDFHVNDNQSSRLGINQTKEEMSTWTWFLSLLFMHDPAVEIF